MQLKASQIFADFKDSGLIGELRGSDCQVSRFSSVEKCKAGDLVFFADKKYLNYIEDGSPSVVVTNTDLAEKLKQNASLTILLSPNVNLAQAHLKQKYVDHDYFNHEWPRIHPSAVIHESVCVPEDCTIGPLAVIGKNVRLGQRVAILASTVIEHDVVIGDDTIIHPHVFIGHSSVLGKQVIINAGAIISGEGFSFTADEQHNHHRIPQTGRVVIGDRVSIGSLSAIDRAAYDETRIENGAIIDNLCQIAHNCQIGENSVIVACCGISGSTKVGARSILSGKTGTLDHINIPSDTVLVHRATVTQSIKEPGIYAGAPLQPLQAFLRNGNMIKKLTEMNKRLKELENTIDKLRSS